MGYDDIDTVTLIGELRLENHLAKQGDDDGNHDFCPECDEYLGGCNCQEEWENS